VDPVKNPFSPGAGSPPPELVGRHAILEHGRILLARVREGRSEKSILLNGLRGVGKTVLLNAIARESRQTGAKAVQLEAHEGKSLAQLLIPPLRSLLYELDRSAMPGGAARRALSVLRSFIGAVKLKYADIEVGLDIEAEKGSADSGDIEADLASLFEAVGEAAKEKNAVVALFIDEIQYLSISEISALIMAMHRMQQHQLPVVLVAAGLPILPALAGESKSYAERLFSFPQVGPLNEIDSARALQDPVHRQQVAFEEEAVKEIQRLTKGYPYFLQEWGYQTWNTAQASPIGVDAVLEASIAVIERLDQGFFRVRFDRLTPREKEFLRSMARLGPGAYRSGDIAGSLNVRTNALGPLRAQLIRKGMIYSPAHGEIAFTVPLFDEFMRRVMPDPKGTL
jgi:DNA polymerase III delta prime subunit